MREYYDRRAPEYDDWYLGRGLFAERDRPGRLRDPRVVRGHQRGRALRSARITAVGPGGPGWLAAARYLGDPVGRASGRHGGNCHI